MSKKPEFYWMQTESDKQRAEKYKKGYTHASRMGFYNSTQWQKIRAYQLTIEPYCQVFCKNQGLIRAAVIADHIEPIPESVTTLGEFLRLSQPAKHLQSSCETCHRKKTAYDKAGKKVLSPEQIRNNMKKYEQ